MSAATPSDQDLSQLAYGYARRLGLCREDAQDCAQDFLVRLLGQQPVQRESPAWMHRCARNFACNYYRNLVRRRASERRAVEEAQTQGRQSGLSLALKSGPRTLVLQRDFWAQVRSLLTQFTQEQQDLFVRYHLRSQDIPDLAARGGRSVHALQQSLHNMHQRLARLLVEQGWSAAEVRQLFGAKCPPAMSRSQPCGR